MSIAGTVLLIAACGGPSATPIPTPTVPSVEQPSPDLSRFYGQQVRWTNCGNADCTKVQVPLDYANPDGPALTLAVTRVPATGERIGSLFVNPGGPGSSAFDYAKAADAIVSDDIRQAYDIIGVDPRGVGASEPVECLTDKERDALLELDGTPDSPQEEQAIVDESTAFAERCREKGGSLVTHIGTVEAARDMDIVRAVAGDPSFNYLGLSYGTSLGAVYAELFPKRVGRMVLDGALPPSLGLVEITKGQAEGLEYAFNDFARDCSTHDDCPFAGEPRDVAEQLSDYLVSLDQNPVMVGDRVLNEAVATYAVLSWLYFPATDYPRLREALADLVAKDDGRPLLDLLDERQARSPDGEYLDNSTDAFYAITCADTTETVTQDEVRRYAKEWQSTAPVFGEALAWGLVACNEWPRAATRPVTQTAAKGSAPILVVSTRHDPATPYPWGVRLADDLENGHLLTWEGTNHTAYLSGSACIDDAVDAYLLRGALPAEGATCK